jgi:hypothetical protein
LHPKLWGCKADPKAEALAIFYRWLVSGIEGLLTNQHSKRKNPMFPENKIPMSDQEFESELRAELKEMDAGDLQVIRFVIYTVKHKTMTNLEIKRMLMAPVN